MWWEESQLIIIYIKHSYIVLTPNITILASSSYLLNRVFSLFLPTIKKQYDNICDML